MTAKNDQRMETTIELTHEMILAYAPNDPEKAMETFELNKATRQMLEKHFNKDEVGKKNEPLAYNQIRNILLQVKKHRDNLSGVIYKLAYIEAKLENDKQKELVRFIRELLEKAIEKKGKEGEQIFKDYMDMLVAYHKYYSTSKS